jgi:hypothetical protein
LVRNRDGGVIPRRSDAGEDIGAPQGRGS